MGYRRFVGNRPLRVLLFESGYHLQRECQAALQALGHQVVCLDVKKANAAEVVRVILQALVAHRPDMVLCINHLGFDDSGTVGNLLQELNVPVACWYVDSPFFVLRGGALPAPRVTTLFSWERTLLPTLKALGAEDAHYLPLGCDLDRFPMQSTLQRSGARWAIGFVGNSMQKPGQKWTRGLPAHLAPLAASWRARLLSCRQDLVKSALEMERANQDVRLWDALASATFSATGSYRAAALRALPPKDLHIFGDPYWRELFPRAHLHPMVPYGPALAATYASSHINVNATSLQMPTAVNQRVFDVPAAGGFLLTDAQEDMAEHFDLGKEAVVYQSPDELRELCAYFGSHPARAQQVAAQARARILRQHTYRHRLAQLVAVMRRRHAPPLVTGTGVQPCQAAPSLCRTTRINARC